MSGITEPGVYADMPDVLYHADPVPEGSLSTSGAKVLVTKTPAHFRAYLNQPRAPKVEFDEGHAAHAEVLGAGLDVEVIPGEWRTNAARAAVEEARAAGKVPLKPEQYERVLGMAERIREHELARALLTNGKPEQSAFWRDERTGVWRRARFDWLPGRTTASGVLVLVDYKTARSADERDFAKAMADYGYHMQADAYCEAARALGINDRPAFVFLVQEKEPPYAINTMQADDDFLRIGRFLNDKALDLYAACQASGEWPAYSQEIKHLAPPGWYANRFPEVLT